MTTLPIVSWSPNGDEGTISVERNHAICIIILILIARSPLFLCRGTLLISYVYNKLLGIRKNAWYMKKYGA